jgi:hypothetical protein
MPRISQFFRWAQETLFPHVETQLGALTEEQERFCAHLEMIHIEDFIPSPIGGWPGRPEYNRQCLARAFLLKAFLNLDSTRALIETLKTSQTQARLCGFPHEGAIPGEATFSRAFADFAKTGLAQQVHAAVIGEFVAETVVGHVNTDSTTIDVPEKAAVKESKKETEEKPVSVTEQTNDPSEPKKKKKKGKKGNNKPPDPKRLERQRTQTVEEACAELPTATDWGGKKNSKGVNIYWKGGKLHLSVADTGVPIAAFYTSASVHDSQVAIPLMRMSSERVLAFYDVMDAAYDATAIYEESLELGRVPIIAPNGRGRDRAEMDPAQKQRLKSERGAVERAFARLKGEFGALRVRVRGGAKVFAHLMFGVLMLTADALFKLGA